MSNKNIEHAVFVRYTVGLLASHSTFKRNQMVKVFFDNRDRADGQLVVTVESARNLNRLNQFGTIVMTKERYDEIADASENSIDFARQIFAMFGISLAGDGF